MGKKLDDKDKNNFQNLADELKPREQMASLPAVTMMSSSSLLAIMLGHGVNGINVLELSNRLITAFGSATELAKADWRMVIERVRAYNEEHPEAPIKGIGKVRAQTLCAAFEFVRRAYDAHDEDFKTRPVTSSDIAYDLFRRALPPNTRQEIFFVLPLDVKGHKGRGRSGSRPCAGDPQARHQLGSEVHHRGAQPPDRRPDAQRRGHRRDGAAQVRRRDSFNPA